MSNTNMDRATPVRGCGKRVTGGCYAESNLCSAGVPLDFFFMDTPLPVASNDISSVGVNLVERGGVWHVLDWVGTKHYENVPDYIEELRRFGLSRRLPSNLNFSKLTAESRIILVHEKAIIRGVKSLRWLKEKSGDGSCQHPSLDKSEQRKHSHRETSCLYALWDTLQPGEREMPSFTYTSNGVGDKGIKYRPGIFAALPISQLVQVRSEEHVKNMERSSIPVQVVDE